MVLRDQAWADDEQRANAPSGNDASRRAPGSAARDASGATSKTLGEPQAIGFARDPSAA